MIFVNAEANSKIHIGRAGEHKTTTVVFDISEWVEEVRNEIDPSLGTVELIVEQNSMSYPQLIEYNREEKKVYWVVTHSNTSEPGIGKCELFYLGKEELTRLFKKPDNWETEYTEYYDAEGNKLVESSPHKWNEEWKNYSNDIPYFYMARPTLKTALYEIIVTNALGYNEEEPPGPYESWVDNVLNASIDIKQAGDEAIAARDETVAARDEVIIARNETVVAKDKAKQYIGNPPIPDENTKTWWVYDPEDSAANKDGYVNTNMPYDFHIDYIVKNQSELATITGMKIGDIAAIQATASDLINAQLYIYSGNDSNNGWEFLLNLSGATGNGISSISKTSSTINERGNIVDTYTITYTLSDPTTFTVTNGKDGADGAGSGDMLKNDYDPNGVVKTTGGIVKYVENQVQESAYSIAETDALLVNKRSWKGGIITGVSILDWASSQNIPTDCACDNSVTGVPYSSYWMVQLSLFPEAGYKTLVAKSITTGEVWSIGCNINTWDSWRKHFDSATMKPSDIGAVSSDEMTEAINTALGNYPAALAAMDAVIGGVSE